VRVDGSEKAITRITMIPAHPVKTEFIGMMGAFCTMSAGKAGAIEVWEEPSPENAELKKTGSACRCSIDMSLPIKTLCPSSSAETCLVN